MINYTWESLNLEHVLDVRSTDDAVDRQYRTVY